MEEIFKDIPNYEGIYQVSNLGRIKSLSREICNSKRCYISKEIILKQRKCIHGYFYIILHNNLQRKTIKTHQLVAMAFLGHKPCGFKLVVNHKDFNKSNNNLDNLEIVSQRENCNRKHLKSSSKYVGVSWYQLSNKWTSSIVIDGKQIRLGYFTDELEASEYYNNALKSINNGEKIITKIKIYSSNYKGVCWSKLDKKWKSYIQINSNRIHLGYFKTEEEAHLAYQLKLKTL
jgi:hypothetical protein